MYLQVSFNVMFTCITDQFQCHVCHLCITGQFQCHVCQKKLKAEHYLKMHLMIHSGEKPFSCTTCGASFNRKDKLKRHMTIHDTTKRFRCPFKSIAGLYILSIHSQWMLIFI